MPQAPKCKLCGVAHWSNEPHVWPDKGSRLHSMDIIDGKTTVSVVDIAPGAPKPTVAEVREAMDAIMATSGPKRDRAAYMRKYRAKTKGQ